MADVKFEVTRVALPLSGTVDATISGFGTPKAAIFIATNANTEDTVSTIARFSYGFTDFTRSYCIGTQFPNNQSTSYPSRRHSDEGVLTFMQATTPPVALITYTAATITDGVRISIGSGSSTNARLCTVILIGGADVTDAYVNFLDDLGTGTSGIGVTAPGFEPDVLFTSSACTPAAPGTSPISNAHNHSLGVAVNGPTVEQRMMAVSGVYGAATTTNSSYISDDSVIGQVATSSLTWKAGLTSFDASGFTITPTASAGSDVFGYLALKFANNPAVKLIDGSWPTSGNASFDFGFQPEFAYFFGDFTNNVGLNTVDTTGNYSVGLTAIDGSSIYTNEYTSQDNVGTSNTQSFVYQGLKASGHGGTLVLEASGHSFTGSGVDFTLTGYPPDASRRVFGLAISGAREKVATVTIDDTTPSAAHSDFPVYVDLADMPSAFWSKMDRGTGVSYDFTGTDADPLPAGWAAQNGTFEIWTNRLRNNGTNPAGAGWVATEETLYAPDVTLTADLLSTVSATATNAIVFRYADIDNFWMAGFSAASNYFRIWRREAGAFNVELDVSQTFNTATTYEVSVVALGDRIEAFVDGVSIGQVSSTFNQTKGKTGWRCSGDTEAYRLDNFSAVPLPGGDIRCFLGETELAREVVSCDTTGQTGELHVKTDLSIIADTVIDIYADGVSSDYAVTDTYGRNAVWSDYEIVSHFSESPTGAITNSTGNTNGTSGGSMTAGDLVTGGIGDGLDFDGSDDVIGYGDSASFTNNNFTVTAYAKIDSTSGRHMLASKWRSFGNNREWLFEVNDNNLRSYTSSTGAFIATSTASGSTAIGTSGYFHAALVVDGASSDLFQYLNGSLDGSDTSATSTIYNGTAEFVVGGEEGTGGFPDAANEFDGIISEIRYRSGTLSADWIADESTNQNTPSTFYTAAAVGGGLTNYSLDLLAGTVSLSGGEVDLTYTPNLTNYSLELDSGTVNLSGLDLSLSASRAIDLLAGAVTLEGGALLLTHLRVFSIDLESGSVTLVGNDVITQAQRFVQLDAGQIDLSGEDINLAYNQTLNNYELTLDAGTVSLTGEQLGLLLGRTISLEAGDVTVEGEATELLRAAVMDLSAGTVSLSGRSVTLLRQLRVELEAGTLSTTGAAITLQAAQLIALEAGDITITGGIVQLTPQGNARVISTIGIPHSAGSGGSGQAGADGADGASAYEIWLGLGNVGTEQDFIDSLVGATGSQGAQGIQGIQGIQGDSGLDGATGAQGPVGPEGPEGPQGPPGADGADGASSVYELVKAKGNIAGVSFDDVENPIAWNAAVIGGTSNVTISGSTITCVTAGTYKFTVTLRTDSGNRTELFIRTYVNGVQDTSEIVSDYVSRDADQDTGAVTLSTALTLAATDTVEFRGFGDTDGTCVGLDDGTILLVERVS